MDRRGEIGVQEWRPRLEGDRHGGRIGLAKDVAGEVIEVVHELSEAPTFLATE